MYLAVLERAAREPSGAAMDSALDIARGVHELVAALLETLRGLSLAAVPPALPLKLKVTLSGTPELTSVLDQWAGGPKPLRVAVEKARSA